MSKPNKDFVLEIPIVEGTTLVTVKFKGIYKKLDDIGEVEIIVKGNR